MMVEVGDSLVTEDGSVNSKGEPANKLKTGGYAATPFIFGAEFAERVAGVGLLANLISYLAFVKHIHLPDAANLTTNFMGTAYTFTLLGGFVADTFLGRFWTIFYSGIIQTLGYVVLIINATLDQFKCLDPNCPPARGTDLATIYVGLYLVALGTGGIKSSVSAFGADQFDKGDAREARQLPHYFNWFYFSIQLGTLVGATAIVYVQDLNWSWGFGSLGIIMSTCLLFFVAFRRLYRYKVPQGSSLTAIARVFVAAFRNRRLARPANTSGFYEDDEARAQSTLKPIQTRNYRWLDKAAILPDGTRSTKPGPWHLATIRQVEDAKMVVRLLPILATTWYFWTVQAQFSTFTVAQSRLSDRNLGPNFTVPPASVGVIQTVAVLFSLILYDKAFMPLARRITGHPSGITTLQRMGLGLATPIAAMVCAALVERRRRVGGQSDFSMFWFVPQYLFMGVGEALLFVGQIDFFYNESPENMQTLGSSLCLSTLAIGAFASTAIVSTVNGVSSSGWIKDNLNAAHLDYYFWLLAVLSALNLAAFLIVSSFHTYKRTFSPKALEDGQAQNN